MATRRLLLASVLVFGCAHSLGGVVRGEVDARGAGRAMGGVQGALGVGEVDRVSYQLLTARVMVGSPTVVGAATLHLGVGSEVLWHRRRHTWVVGAEAEERINLDDVGDRALRLGLRGGLLWRTHVRDRGARGVDHLLVGPDLGAMLDFGGETLTGVVSLGLRFAWEHVDEWSLQASER